MNLACEGSRQAKRGGREQRPPRSSPSLLQARGLYTAEIPRRFPAGVPRARALFLRGGGGPAYPIVPSHPRGLFLRGVGSFPLRRRPFLLEGPSDLLDAVLGKTPCVPSFAYILLYMASSLAWVCLVRIACIASNSEGGRVSALPRRCLGIDRKATAPTIATKVICIRRSSRAISQARLTPFRIDRVRSSRTWSLYRPNSPFTPPQSKPSKSE